jgi:lysophosphatidate acyltransferase
MTAADVDNLTKSTRESMLKTLLEMSSPEDVDNSNANTNAKTTAVEI